MLNVVVAVVLVAAAIGVALVARSRQRRSAPVARAFTVPTHLDRAEFDRLTDAVRDQRAPWLVVVFTSATCQACENVAAKARALASASVQVALVEYGAQRAIHERYGIDAVPLTLVTDVDGTVVDSFTGPVTATDLWAAVAEAREPGSTGGGHCSSPARSVASSGADEESSMLP